MNYFVNTGDFVEFYDTQEQAIAAANNAIDVWRERSIDDSSREWSEDVESVCWGPIHGQAKQIYAGENNEFVDYELTGTKPDWRIGLSVKPKYRNDELYYERGVIEAVFPSGTGGLIDKDGVVRVRMQSGMVILRKADDWVTA